MRQDGDNCFDFKRISDLFHLEQHLSNDLSILICDWYLQRLIVFCWILDDLSQSYGNVSIYLYLDPCLFSFTCYRFWNQLNSSLFWRVLYFLVAYIQSWLGRIDIQTHQSTLTLTFQNEEEKIERLDKSHVQENLRCQTSNFVSLEISLILFPQTKKSEK
mgnify:CR=1 FL=1